MPCCLLPLPWSLQALSKLARLPDPEPAAAGDKKAAEAAQRVDAARKQAGRCLLRVLDALDVWVGPIKDSMLRGADAEAAAAEQVGGVGDGGHSELCVFVYGWDVQGGLTVFITPGRAYMYCDAECAWAVSWCSGSAQTKMLTTDPRPGQSSFHNYGC
jgi:hypothetical protein